MVRRSSEFEAAIRNRDRASLRLFCYKKSQESEYVTSRKEQILFLFFHSYRTNIINILVHAECLGRSEDDRETWGFLKAMFEDDGTATTKLLTHFGFSLPYEAKDGREDDLSQEASAVGAEDEVADEEKYDVDKNTYLYGDGEDIFNYLPSSPAGKPVSDSGDSFTSGGSVPIVEEMQQEMDGQEENDDPSFYDSIQRALVVGNYKGAVARCIAAKKMADALVIAHVGGGSLWESTRDQYLKMSGSPYLEVISARVNKDLTSLVNTRPLISWKETLALLCTFEQGEKWSSLCDSLASTLMTVGKTLPATLFYICAGNIDKTVEIWSRGLISENAGRSNGDHLQDFMEKTIVLALATGQKKFSASTRKLVEECAETLACQGILTTAKECLNLMGTDESSPELMILQDCIAWSTHIEKEVPKSSTVENSQSLPGTTYGADKSSFRAVESSGHYHQHSVSGSPCGGNYQPSFGSPYAGGNGAPVPYQPAPNPQTFLPSQAPQVPQGTTRMEASLHKLQAAMAPVREHDDCGTKDKFHRQGRRYSTVEPKTNSIDRVVATLLFTEAATSKGGSSN
ncbi:hypothetical protein RHMOL_Rhmol02G0251400 [Rhododendron molle]|uniref:Uncharacterized protein n=1 Tax=Rhododendron molle TaxID=49168 RepID=A0ACC0PVR3_RHOML|nr:hypothetical protein RHMOL_Rhmol02G0251400 [Rhododendron molle]